MNELEQEKGMLDIVLSLYSVSKFIKDACDLIIFHENLPSTFYGVEDSQYEL